MRRHWLLGAALVLPLVGGTMQARALTPSVTLTSPVSHGELGAVQHLEWNYTGFHPSALIDVEMQAGGGPFDLIDRVSIDDGSFGNFGSYEWDTAGLADGHYTLRVRVPSNVNVSSSAPVFRDTQGPVAILESQTEPNAAGWNNTPVTVTWRCEDAVSGSVEPMVTDVIDTEGTDQTADAQCADVDGNTTSASLGGIDVDLTDADTTIDSEPVLQRAGAPVFSGTLTGTASDELSGVAAVDVTVRSIVGGVSTTLPASLDLDSNRWTFQPDAQFLTGLYTFSVATTDIAGNTEESPAILTAIVV